MARLLFAAALSLLPLTAGAEGADITRGCYVAQFSPESGQIDNVRLSIPEGETAAERVFGARISAGLRGTRDPDIEDSGMGCGLEGTDSVFCAVECDGGQARWSSIGEDLILLQTDSLAMNAGAESLLLGLEPYARGLSLDGAFVLQRADPAQCARSSANAPLVAELRPGDLTPAVMRVEAALQDLGYFSGTPDWVYDAESAAAVSAFQQALNLEATGTVTGPTLELLGLYAVLEGGC